MPLRRISREWALRYLYQLDVSGDEMTESSLSWFWAQMDESDDKLEAREIRKCRKLALTLIRGVLQHVDTIDVDLERVAKDWDLDRIAAVDRNILRIGIYEICYVNSIPTAVSINEALEICRSYGGGEHSRPLINGILDKISREFMEDN